MFINDVNKKEDIRKIAIQTLKKYGIKFREKQNRQISQVFRSTKFFKVPLRYLENETITLKNGQQLIIPKQLYEICSFICGKIETEGIFRKEGSRSRQQEIKLLLDRGCTLDDHHVIDVAVVLKYFLRELPEPLIPYSFHELFLRCSLHEKKIETILLACLLLPTEHLNVLSFLMQFFTEVANHSHYNKMNSHNIATMVGPNIFPISEKIDPKNKLMVTRSCNIIKIMIENSYHIGEIPDYIIEQIGKSSIEDDFDLKIKRSGSFTRIFHGLKKIVGNKSDEEMMTKTVTPDILISPFLSLSTKRQSKDLLQQGTAKEDPWNRKSGTGKMNRRWSSITPSTSKKKKRRSLIIHLSNKELNTTVGENNENENVNDNLKMIDNEYEEIKNRVYEIEQELTRGFENIKRKSMCHVNIDFRNSINNIQSAYEQTLVQNEPLSPTTDHLARRLSKELRIRTSEQKIIRSPSARKIGNMKRRSREMEKPNKILKSASFHYNDFRDKNNEISKYNVAVKSDGMSKIVTNTHCKRAASFNSQSNTNIPCKLRTQLSITSPNASKVSSSVNSYAFSKKIHNNITSPSKRDSKNINLLGDEDVSRKRRCINTDTENLSSQQLFSGHHNTKKSTTFDYSDGLCRLKGKPIKSNVICVKKNFVRSTKESKERSIEDNLIKHKYLSTYSSVNVPHIKKSIVPKSPKRYCSTSSSTKNTPLKVLSTS